MTVCKGCTNAVRIGCSMLDVRKWFKDNLELTSESYTNFCIAQGTGDITVTSGIKGGSARQKNIQLDNGPCDSCTLLHQCFFMDDIESRLVSACLMSASGSRTSLS